MGWRQVLVLVDQHPAKAGEQTAAQLIRLVGRQAVTVQQCDRLVEDFIEVVGIGLTDTTSVARPYQPHGERVAGHDDHAASVGANELRQPPAYLDRGVTVVREGDDATGVLAADA